MSEKDRMDRAKRIRQMREGERDDDEKPEMDEETPETDGTADGVTADGSAVEEEPGGTESPASADGGATAASNVEDEEDATEKPDAGEARTDASAGEGTSEGSTAEGPEIDTTGEISAPLPDTEEVEEVVGEGSDGADDTEESEERADADGEGSVGPAGVGEEGTTTEEKARVLEFTLDDERYCLDIEFIEEIVEKEKVTRVPNTPEFVEGVVDLRGQITTIVNPKVPLEREDREAGEIIVVFDADAFDEGGNVGWAVDDVRQVAPVTDDQVRESPMEQEYVNGIVDRAEDDEEEEDDEGDEEFVIWTTPDLIFEGAVESETAG